MDSLLIFHYTCRLMLMGIIHIISDANIVVSGLLHSIKKRQAIFYILEYGVIFC